jgi:hypothetical protein
MVEVIRVFLFVPVAIIPFKLEVIVFSIILTPLVLTVLLGNLH